MFHNCTEFESEGIVYETMKQTLNHSFSVDGVIHLIMNHQVWLYYFNFSEYLWKRYEKNKK